jgi:hypothetical protein
MDVCLLWVFVLSCTGLYVGPIPRPEESHRLWSVCECDQVKTNNFDTCCEWVEKVRTTKRKTVSLLGARRRQIQFVINWVSSEGKSSPLARCDVILLHYYKVLNKCLSILLFVVWLFVLSSYFNLLKPSDNFTYNPV